MMRCSPECDLPAAAAALSLDQLRGQISTRCVRRLDDAGSPLVRDEDSRRQMITQIDRILDDTVAVLRDGAGSAATRRPDQLSVEIGAHRARHGISPAESVRAADVLFESAVSAVADDLAAVDERADGMIRFCLALHHSLMKRLDVAARSYLSTLLDRIHDASATELLSLSREVHDHVAHPVVLAQQQLSLYEQFRPVDLARAEARLDAARRHLTDALESCRGLSARLRSSRVSEGLQTALIRHLATAPPSVATSVTVDGDESAVPPAVRDQLQLLLREAARNALQHADPRSITVMVQVFEDRVEAVLSDDGSGFDVTAQRAAPTGTGLASMAERLHSVGGSFAIDSERGGGTTVRARVPLPRRPT